MPKVNKDIRFYFTTLNSKKEQQESKPLPRKRPKISSDEDEIQQSPVKRSKKIVQKRNVKKSILSDSDDEETAKKNVKNEKPKEVKKENKVEKVVSTQELFGKTPIRRVAAPKIERKSQIEKKSDLMKKESMYHDDADFEIALEQLDASNMEIEYLNTSMEELPKSTNLNTENVIQKHKPSPKKIKDVVDAKSAKKIESSSSMDSSMEGNNKPDLSKFKNKSHVKDENKKDTSSKIKNEKKKTGSSKIEIEKHESTKPTKNEVKKEDDPFAAVIEKKKHNTALYKQYLNRGGARNPGSKEIPKGADYCLAGLRFLITGVLDSLEREEADELIIKYGGCVVHSVSKKLDYLIVGDEAGPSKISKAAVIGIKQISEDDLLNMIRTNPAGKASAVVHTQHKKTKKEETNTSTNHESPKEEIKKGNIQEESPKEEIKKETIKEESPLQSPNESINKEGIKQDVNQGTQPSFPSSKKINSPIKSIKANEISKPEKKEFDSKAYEINGEKPDQSPVEALVEKYRPKTMKQIIGQQDNKSNANKLYKWLSNWHKNRTVTNAKPAPWKSDDGAFFKAALLSGPPGVGKTTTVQVVCKELGFDFIEFNASDTRSKKLLHEEVSGILSNTTMLNYFTRGNKEKPTKKHVLVMDEVDGMAGNEDRGGLQELIALIKSTSVPIICICNDRNHPKMRTLSNYTYDLRFPKPILRIIKAAMLSICHKEAITIQDKELEQLIKSTDQDVRQVINHLALYKARSTIDSESKSEEKKQNKDLRLGNWDVARKVFSAEEHKNMSIHDKSDLFFHDYNIAPLFVQENYLSVKPKAPERETLERMAEAAESIAIGDTIETMIRKNNAWSLLPTQAMFSSVIPGTVMSGQISAQINFPSWLGRNSKRGKCDRLLQEITVHSRMTTGASKEAINLDYLKSLRNKIVRPLVTKELEGVDEAVNAMNTYHLIREDLDSLIELSLWPGQRDPMQSVNSKVKAAFTRSYNKNSLAYGYLGAGVSKKKGAALSPNEDLMDEQEVENESGEDEDIDNDKMIKAKKPTAKDVPSTSKAESSKAPSGRGRGRGRGKTK